jgi:hypothetical protein
VQPIEQVIDASLCIAVTMSIIAMAAPSSKARLHRAYAYY